MEQGLSPARSGGSGVEPVRAPKTRARGRTGAVGAQGTGTTGEPVPQADGRVAVPGGEASAPNIPAADFQITDEVGLGKGGEVQKVHRQPGRNPHPQGYRGGQPPRNPGRTGSTGPLCGLGRSCQRIPRPRYRPVQGQVACAWRGTARAADQGGIHRRAPFNAQRALHLPDRGVGHVGWRCAAWDTVAAWCWSPRWGLATSWAWPPRTCPIGSWVRIRQPDRALGRLCTRRRRCCIPVSRRCRWPTTLSC